MEPQRKEIQRHSKKKDRKGERVFFMGASPQTPGPRFARDYTIAKVYLFIKILSNQEM